MFAAFGSTMTQQHKPRYLQNTDRLPTTRIVSGAWNHFAADASSGLAATTPRALGPNGRGPYGGVYSTDSLVRRTVRENHRLAVTCRHVLLVRRLCLAPLAPAVGLCPRPGPPSTHTHTLVIVMPLSWWLALGGLRYGSPRETVRPAGPYQKAHHQPVLELLLPAVPPGEMPSTDTLI